MSKAASTIETCKHYGRREHLPQLLERRQSVREVSQGELLWVVKLLRRACPTKEPRARVLAAYFTFLPPPQAAARPWVRKAMSGACPTRGEGFWEWSADQAHLP